MVPMTAARGVMYRSQWSNSGRLSDLSIHLHAYRKALDDGEVAKLAALLKMKPKDITKKVNDQKYGYEPIRIANDISYGCSDNH